MITPDALADAACAKASAAPHGEKKKRARVRFAARHLALALNVRTMRISMKGDAQEPRE